MGRGLVEGVRLGAAVLLLVEAGCASSPFADLPDPREANDCVEFTKDASADAGEATGDVLAPGQRPSLDVDAYWFGPTLGPRRAIVATEQEIDLSNSDEPELVPIYMVVYQLPADGCQSGLLPGYDPSPHYWGPGREIQVMSEPLEAPLTQRLIREFGGVEGKPRVPLANGEEAVVLELGEATVGVVVGETFVTVQDAHPERVRALLHTLRPVGE